MTNIASTRTVGLGQGNRCKWHLAVRRGRTDHLDVPRAIKRDRDRGESLLEVLITVALLGTVVAATLTALSTTVRGTSQERDRALAQLWLQSAVDSLRATPVQDCNDPGQTEPVIRAAYETAVRSASTPPPGWEPTQLSVAPPVLFWDPNLRFQSVCYDDYGFELQLVELQVVPPNGHGVERVQVVLGGG